LRKQRSSQLCSSIRKGFSKAEVEAGVSGVLANVLDAIWEAVREAGGPLRCLEDEQPVDDDEDI